MPRSLLQVSLITVHSAIEFRDAWGTDQVALQTLSLSLDGGDFNVRWLNWNRVLNPAIQAAFKRFESIRNDKQSNIIIKINPKFRFKAWLSIGFYWIVSIE